MKWRNLSGEHIAFATAIFLVLSFFLDGAANFWISREIYFLNSISPDFFTQTFWDAKFDPVALLFRFFMFFLAPILGIYFSLIRPFVDWRPGIAEQWVMLYMISIVNIWVVGEYFLSVLDDATKYVTADPGTYVLAFSLTIPALFSAFIAAVSFQNLIHGRVETLWDKTSFSSKKSAIISVAVSVLVIFVGYVFLKYPEYVVYQISITVVLIIKFFTQKLQSGVKVE